MRFGITNMIRKYTVHRGMFHSIPAGLIFAGLAFLICGGIDDLHIRYYKAGAVLAGFMSHLILDEIYSVEWKSGAWHLKKSSGTAFKLWGDDGWANFSCYAKLVLIAGIILGEPSVMEQIESRHPRNCSTLPGTAAQLPRLVRRDRRVGQHQGAGRPVIDRGRAVALELVRSAAAGPIATGRHQLPAAQLRPTQLPIAAGATGESVRSTTIASTAPHRQRLRHSPATDVARPAIARAHNSAVVDPQRHRPVVHERDVHVRPEHTRLRRRRRARGPARQIRRTIARPAPAARHR